MIDFSGAFEQYVWLLDCSTFNDAGDHEWEIQVSFLLEVRSVSLLNICLCILFFFIFYRGKGNSQWNIKNIHLFLRMCKCNW